MGELPTRTRVDRLLWPLPERQVVVLDTTNIMNRLAARVSGHRDRTSLFELPPRVFASDHVFDELYRGDDWGTNCDKWDKLSQQATARGERTTASEFREIFEREYLPKIVFVDMGEVFSTHPVVEAVRRQQGGRGASDAPTAQLAVLLSRMSPIVFSEDRHLSKPGVAPSLAVLPEITIAGVDAAEGAQVAAVGSAATVGAIYGLDWGAQGLGKLVGSPSWFSRVVLAAGAIWLLSSASRRDTIGSAAAPFIETFAHYTDKTRRGEAVLSAARAQVEPDQSLEAHIAEALVRRAHVGGQLAGEVHDMLGRPIDTPKASMIKILRERLVAAPCFEEGPRGRFSLGHSYE